MCEVETVSQEEEILHPNEIGAEVFQMTLSYIGQLQ